MATPLAFTAPPTARPTIAPPGRSRSDLMAYLLEQNQPDNMIANPPHTAGEGIARTAGMGLDALMAKKVLGSQRDEISRQNRVKASILAGEDTSKIDHFLPMVEAGVVPESAYAQAAGFGPKPSILIEDQFDETTGQETKVISYDGGATWKPFGGKKAPAGEDPVKIQNISAMRKEYETQPGTSRYRLSQPMLASMMTNTDTGSAMSDFDFIYGMGKIYDPSSTILMGEAGMVLQGQSIPEQVKGYLDKALQGKASLGPQARRDLVNAAMVRVAEYRKQADAEAEHYRRISSEQDIDPMLVVRDLEELPTWPKTPLVAVPAATDVAPDPAEVEAEMKRRGLM